ncbi:MAG: ABC transporter permease [Vicinamibacterales bacterium]|nr:ABC transporter permease [Vicinamibacterales bacterium]
MGRLVFEIKVAVRTLLRARFVSVLAVLAFALGIGVTTAVFSVFNSVLLAPLPFPDPGQIVAVYDTQPACATCPASFPKYHDWRDRNQVFAAIGGITSASFVMTGNGEPARVVGASTTASLVDVFGVPPVLGRWFTPDEDQPGGPKVVVLAHEFWTRQFGADPAVLGRTVMLDGAPVEVIGVMPPGFTLRRAEAFVPLQRALDPATRGSHFLATFARLRDGVTVDQAAREMRALGETLADEFRHNHGIDVRAYHEVVVGSVRTPLQVLLGAVLLLLLIACANVANLLLASGLARRRELAIRQSLGAGRWQLARQLSTESLLLAGAGGVLGLVLAHWSVRAFVALAGTELPRATSIAIDGRVLLFAAAVSAIVGLVCGLLPLVLVRGAALAEAVREGDTRTASGAGGRVGRGLVVAEIAVAFALLVGSGLLVKNLVLLQGRDTGMRTERIVTFGLAPAGPRYEDPAQVLGLYRELHSRFSSLGTVELAGMTSHLPMRDFGWNGEFQIEGETPWGPGDAPLVEYRWMYGDYLQAIGVPLVQGRLLDARDRDGSRTVLVNRAMAEKFWPGQDPIGRRFGQGPLERWYEVVGVIEDTRSLGLGHAAPYEFYRTIEQSSFGPMTVVLRTTAGDPMTVIGSVRQIVAAVDPLLPLSRIQTLDAVVSESVGQPRLMSALTAAFGVLAGLLAMMGVYGVMAYTVRRQRREFGIRAALGAGRAQMWSLVFGRGLRLAAAGVGFGAAGAWALTRVLASMLHDVRPHDPTVFAATAAAVLAVVLLASVLPARTAARVDPMVVLRD